MNKTTLRPNLPHAPGVYLMRDVRGDIVYIGKARDLKKRVASYFLSPEAGNPLRGPKIQALIPLIRHVDYVATASEREALLLEQRLIQQHQPMFNTMWKDDKSYPYVVLTMKEDFPRLRLTRQRKRDGSLYFGPYPSVGKVRNLLKWVWRNHLFPLRPCDIPFTEKNLPPFKKVRSCLYLHTGECPAPCVGKIASKPYKTIAERAKWFFSGHQERTVEEWEKEMAQLSKEMEFEKAGRVRDRLETLKHMREDVTFREMSEDMVATRVQDSRGVQELMTALALPQPPYRIECFDISHIQGDQKVASMVSFERGRPDKSQYRKFIIRTVKGIDDFQSMAEVVGRRYRRLKEEGKSFPDLVLIDGGKGQLSFALSAINALKIRGLFVAALAKQEEEVFLPGRSESVRLPMDSPALLLLRHVRDEAHRFAISFHRQRRRKALLKGSADA